MADTTPVSEVVATHLRDIPDFPEPGVLFKDVTPLLRDGAAHHRVVRDVADRHRGNIDVVVGVEARGFILGAAVAHELGLGFVPVRKAGKLPAKTLSVDYALEYGTATVEVHADAFEPGSRALVLDDVLATGGTGVAACELVQRAGATVVAFEVLVEITALGGRERMAGHPLHALLRV